MSQKVIIKNNFKKGDKMECPYCETETRYYHQGQVACPKCYKVFNEQMLALTNSLKKKEKE